MNFENIFAPYQARNLTQADASGILALYSENTEYFKHCPPSPSLETVKEDLVALPPAKEAADKYYIGIFEGNSLVAVMDLIDRYPDRLTAFIGLLMVSKSCQGKGVGAYLVKALSQALGAEGYTRIRLGYIKTNLSAQRFWRKQGFQPTGAASVREHFTVMEAEKILSLQEQIQTRERPELNAQRDRMMADNTLWILQQEQARGNSRILISGHNNHIMRCENAGTPVLGSLLAEDLGRGYFAIGTDFYKSVCNLPKPYTGKRITHTFYSYDPLAKASKQCGLSVSFLDFSTVPESSSLMEYLTNRISMGSLGESYSVLMNFVPRSYRVQRTPQEAYDAMAFVANATPIEIQG